MDEMKDSLGAFLVGSDTISTAGLRYEIDAKRCEVCVCVRVRKRVLK